MGANEKLRRKARAGGVRHWQIAEALGVSEPTLTRWLRYPLTPERESRINEIIDDLTVEVE